MNKPLGGRGKRAPYETQVVRVPVPIIGEVEQIIEEYRLLAIKGEVSEFKKHPELAAAVTPVSYSEALIHARQILRYRKSAAESLAKLLQVLYGGTISKADLR
jgi:hypothetical protein